MIDGVFENEASVFHKEILWALSNKIPVFGAASMGALRAAELTAFGMVGFGEVFHQYEDGTLDRDDAVAVLHGPSELGYHPLTSSLVDMWATFYNAEKARVIGVTEMEDLLSASAKTNYRMRTYDVAVGASSLSYAHQKQLLSWIRSNMVSIKAQDAVGLLRHLARMDGIPPIEPTFRFEWTIFWDRLTRECDLAALGISNLELTGILSFLVETHRYEDIEREAIAIILADREAFSCGSRVEASDFNEAALAFRRKSGLTRASDVQRWIDSLGLTHSDYVSLITNDFHLAAAKSRYAPLLSWGILSALLRKGELSLIVEQVRRQFNSVQQDGDP
nr:TfuA-like protein [Mesorhizobium camelthorni]